MDDGNGGGLIAGGNGLVFGLVGLVIAIICIVGLWKMFEKAGKPGWAAIIPVYNYWVMFEIVGLKGWYALGLFIPIVNLVVMLLALYAVFKLPQCYGKDMVWGILAIVCFPVVACLIGFGDAQYQGSGA